VAVYFTIKDLADILGCTRQNIRHYMKNKYFSPSRAEDLGDLLLVDHVQVKMLREILKSKGHKVKVRTLGEEFELKL
jgi:DNA-binding transcriptional MerR regulator